MTDVALSRDNLTPSHGSAVRSRNTADLLKLSQQWQWKSHAAEQKEQMSINMEIHLLLGRSAPTGVPESPGLRRGPAWPPVWTPSYRRGAAVRCVGLARVFHVLLDAVVDLQEVVVPLRVVGGGGRARGLEGVPGQRVHGDLCGRQRAEALKAHRRGVTGV